jgi:hypothetical protein
MSERWAQEFELRARAHWTDGLKEGLASLSRQPAGEE